MKRLTALLLVLAAPAAFGVTVSDDFNRANGAIGANYTVSLGSAANITILSNQLEIDNAAEVLAVRTAETFANDQEVTVTIASTLTSGQNYVEVVVRASGTDGTFVAYSCYTDGASGAGHTEIAEYAGGTPSVLKSVATTFATNDTIGCRVVGTTISMLKNGSVVDSTTDATLASGKIGVGGYGGTSTLMDNLTGGDVAAGGGTQPPRTMHQFRLRTVLLREIRKLIDEPARITVLAA